MSSVVKIHCPRCSSSFRIKRELSGKKVICPKCKGKVKVPDLDLALGTEKQAVTAKQEGAEIGEAAVKVAAATKSANTSSKKQQSKVPEVSLDSLLPPSVNGEVGVEPKPEVPLPQVVSATVATSSKPASSAPSIAVLDEVKASADPKAIPSLHEPVRTVSSGGKQRQIQQRSNHDRARRRFRKNLIMWTLCAIVMIVAMIVLMNFGG